MTFIKIHLLGKPFIKPLLLQFRKKKIILDLFKKKNVVNYCLLFFICSLSYYTEKEYANNMEFQDGHPVR
jgi:hypothetical protein